jgi:soluble P-type ATPase
MMTIDVPGFGLLRLEHLVSDFTGTLSEDGRLVPGVKERLNTLAEKLAIHVLTADTFGRAREELSGVHCSVRILEGSRHDVQKERYVSSLGQERVVALGNGMNDWAMLSSARLGMAVSLGEGCATNALKSADVFVPYVLDALDILLEPRRLVATLRY